MLIKCKQVFIKERESGWINFTQNRVGVKITFEAETNFKRFESGNGIVDPLPVPS